MLSAEDSMPQRHPDPHRDPGTPWQNVPALLIDDQMDSVALLLSYFRATLMLMR
jgi:hypothetical protein